MNFILVELARLRWIDNWPRAKLAERYDRSPETITMWCVRLKKGRLAGINLSAKEKRLILRIWKDQRALTVALRLFICTYIY